MFLIVTPTYHKRDKFADLLFEFLGTTWPGHPPVWFITDGNSIRHRNTIRIKSENWVLILHDGLQQLKAVFPGLAEVFLLLEDAYPLWPCEVGRIIDAEKAMAAGSLNCVVFTPFVWGPPERRISTDKGELYEVPKTFLYYSQLQPSLWKLDHLIQTCQIARQRAISDCWRFEQIVTDGHYVSDYRWPTIMDGLFRGGYINIAALKKIKMSEGLRLKRKLVRQLLEDFPGHIFLRIKNVLNRRINRLISRLVRA